MNLHKIMEILGNSELQFFANLRREGIDEQNIRYFLQTLDKYKQLGALGSKWYYTNIPLDQISRNSVFKEYSLEEDTKLSEKFHKEVRKAKLRPIRLEHRDIAYMALSHERDKSESPILSNFFKNMGIKSDLQDITLDLGLLIGITENFTVDLDQIAEDFHVNEYLNSVEGSESPKPFSRSNIVDRMERVSNEYLKRFQNLKRLSVSEEMIKTHRLYLEQNNIKPSLPQLSNSEIELIRDATQIQSHINAMSWLKTKYRELLLSEKSPEEAYSDILNLRDRTLSNYFRFGAFNLEKAMRTHKVDFISRL